MLIDKQKRVMLSCKICNRCTDSSRVRKPDSENEQSFAIKGPSISNPQNLTIAESMVTQYLTHAISASVSAQSKRTWQDFFNGPKTFVPSISNIFWCGAFSTNCKHFQRMYWSLALLSSRNLQKYCDQRAKKANNY